MNKYSSRRLLAGVASVAALCVPAPVLAMSPAHAVPVPAPSSQTSPSAPGTDEVARALGVADTHLHRAVPTTVGANGFATPDGEVTLPTHAGGDVIVDADGIPVGIGIPGGPATPGRRTPNGIAFEGAAADTTVVTTAVADGGTQILAVLGSSEAPTSLSFPVRAAAGSSLVANQDGSVSLQRPVSAPDGSVVPTVVGAFTAPWAVDATGRALPTRYEVRGMELVQIVETDATTQYPVTADPTFVAGWTGLFVHWKESEVKWLAGLTLASTGAALSSLCAGPQVMLCAAAAGGIWYALSSVSDATVGAMYDNGYRLTTRLTPFIATYWEKR